MDARQLDSRQLIKRPLVTEKSTWEADKRNRYSFEVDRLATKPEIKLAIEEIYKVRVVKVSTQVRKGIWGRNKWRETLGTDWKRATVQLHPEDKIHLF